MRIKKVCEFCKQPFIAQTTTTKYCTHRCNQKAYKANAKKAKITKAILETNEAIKEKFVNPAVKPTVVNDKSRLNFDWVGIKDLSVFIGLSERTLFRLIQDPAFPKLKVGKRLLFRKDEVVNYLNSKKKVS